MCKALSEISSLKDLVVFSEDNKYRAGFDIYISDSELFDAGFEYGKSFVTPIKLMDVILFIESRIEDRAMGINIGKLKFNPFKKLISVGYEQMQLTDSESKVLLVIYESADGINKHGLTVKALGYADDAETSAIENHINNLREKLAKLDCSVEIVTQKGLYIIQS